jgi:hypothetical protein
MKQVASNYHGKNNANLLEVAINWCHAKGTIPIPGAGPYAKSNPTMEPWSGT